MTLTEAEIQVLACLWATAGAAGVSSEANLRKHAEVYQDFLEDWTGAAAGLAAKGLIAEAGQGGWRLTDAGRGPAKSYGEERLDHFWYYYRTFYPAAYASAAHSRYCERVYGKDLCQEGQVDMADLGDLLTWFEIKPGERLLDLGCGAGAIARYLAEETGAQVTALDCAASAMAAAKERWADVPNITFQQGDMNALDFPPASFDIIMSLDTLYWAADLERTLGDLARMLKPGGRLGVYIAQSQEDGDPAEILEADKTDFAKALTAVGLTYEARAYTAQNQAFWQRIQEAALALRDDFEAEGNGYMARRLLKEAEQDFLPVFEAGTLARYLYLVKV